MKRRNTILLVAALLAFAPCVATGLADETTGEIAVGATVVKTDDSLNRASEFRHDDSSEVFAGWWDISFGDGGFLELDLYEESSWTQNHRLRWRMTPSLRLDAAFQRLVHQLPHDPLTNLNATDEAGKVVRSEDLDPLGRYRTRFEVGHAALTWQPENARAWTVALHARQVKRSGGKQQLSTGHCMTCHIVSQARALDESANDVGAVLAFQKPAWGVRLEVTSRSFDDDAQGVLREFEQARHPVLKAPVFDNRVQYGIGGPATLPVGVVVGHDKLTATLHAWWTGASDHVDGAITTMNTESDTTGLQVDYRSARARWLHAFGNTATTLSLAGRWEDLSSDDIFVDVFTAPNPVGPGPPPIHGQTYEDLYGPSGSLRAAGFVADFTRRSPADRTVTTAEAELVHRFGADRRQRFRIGLRSRAIDREAFRVNDAGDTETSEYLLRAGLSGRLGRTWRYRTDLEWLQADDTFKNVNGAVRAPGLTDTPGSPGPFFREQYFELYRLRFGDLTNVPSDSLALRANLSYSPGPNASWTFHGSWRDQRNDETGVGEWSREAVAVGTSVWWAPASRVWAVASADLVREDQETLVSIPLFDG
ncbi:MAG: hypothetical protein Kow0062_01220 [Acidobacteriota bacterium]